MTTRLYYTEPYRTEFEAKVLDVETVEGRCCAVLDRTLFYPTSGGQPFDTGTLGEARVVDVVDRGGTIAHVLEASLSAGAHVRGRIDWPRRFDHMQQHSGQHILSAAFERSAAARTVSFRLGTADSTIDLDRQVTPDAVRQAEQEANQVVWEDRPVTIRFAEADEAARLALRKEPARQGRLRIIEIAGWDVSACGGTHVERTGAVGAIVVAGAERFKGGTRLTFLCGRRALDGYRDLRAAVDSATRLLSGSADALPAAIARLQDEAREARRVIRALQTRLVDAEAAELAARARPVGTVRLVAEPIEGRDAGGLKAVASALAARPGHAAVLLARDPGGAWLCAIAHAADVRGDAAALLRALTEVFGGRGGGGAGLAQGGGLAGAADDIVAAAATHVERHW